MLGRSIPTKYWTKGNKALVQLLLLGQNNQKSQVLQNLVKLATSAQGRHTKLITFMQNVLHNLPC